MTVPTRRQFLGLLGGAGGALTCARTPAAPLPAVRPRPVPATREEQSNPATASETETVLEEGRSEWNHVLVTEVGSLRKMYFVNGDKRMLQSTYDRSRPDALHHEVFQTMVSALIVQPGVRRLCMIGLGGGQLTNYLFRHVHGLEIDVVDICPEVVRLARRWFGVPEHPHYRTHVRDGRVFIEELAPGSLDVLVLDAYRGHSVPRHLRTAEFMEACARALAPGGVVVANMHRLTPRYSVDRATMASVFRHVYRFSSADDVQTSVVGTMAEDAPAPAALLDHARALQPGFDIDLVALAARVRIDEAGWDTSLVPHDDFEPATLPEAARRHNLSCAPRCAGDGS